jgi:bacteriorhodopsin
VALCRYVWWVLAVAFLLIVLLILGRVLHAPNGRAARHLITLTAVTWIIYPIVWITGSYLLPPTLPPRTLSLARVLSLALSLPRSLPA